MKPSRSEQTSQDYCETEEGKWIAAVRSIIRNLKYGDVHLTIHDGKVVEIRKIEKIRMDTFSSIPSPKRCSHS